MKTQHALIVKFLSPTNTLGARLKATLMGKSKSVDYYACIGEANRKEGAVSNVDVYTVAADELIKKINAEREGLALDCMWVLNDTALILPCDSGYAFGASLVFTS